MLFPSAAVEGKELVASTGCCTPAMTPVASNRSLTASNEARLNTGAFWVPEWMLIMTIESLLYPPLPSFVSARFHHIHDFPTASNEVPLPTYAQRPPTSPPTRQFTLIVHDTLSRASHTSVGPTLPFHHLPTTFDILQLPPMRPHSLQT